MSARKGFATGAAIVALSEAAWFVASNFSLIKGWITSLQARGGIADSIASFVTNPVFHLLVVCAALYLAVRAFRTATDTVPAMPPAPVQANAQNVSINFPLHPPDEKPKKTALEPRARPHSNVQFLSTKTTSVYFVNADHLPYFSAKGPGDEIAAILVGFRNDTIVGKPALDADRSKTHVLYHDSDGLEMASILGVCCLDEPGDLINLEVGKAVWFIVALFPIADSPMIPFYQRRRSTDGFGDTVRLEDHEIHGAIETIEVRIIGEWNDELIRVRLRCSTDEKGKPKLTKLGS